jgi:hypothetical protein
LSYGTGYDLSKSFSDFDRRFPYSPLIKTIARRKKNNVAGCLPRAAKKSHWVRKRRLIIEGARRVSAYWAMRKIRFQRLAL